MVNTQVVVPQQVYIHMETTNQSFVNMHYYLKGTGRSNNNFFLVLYDAGLAGVDPRDPHLSIQMKQRITRECVCNYWYFLREIVQIEQQSGHARYRLDRGSLAMNFLFTLNYNMFVELPRQFGKTTTAIIRYLWVYNFGASNSDFMFVHKDHAGSKNNLKKLKDMRDSLPSYLQMSSAIGLDGKRLKVPNTIVMMEHPINGNKIVTFASARSKDSADKMGRGCTQPIQYYDEFAFMPYNQFAYLAAVPAFSTASANAKAHGGPYGIMITTTPGDLTTNEGQYAYAVRNSATPWNEAYYDYSYDQLEQLRLSNTKSSFFLIRYTYQQLGKGNDYFNQMCTDMGNNWPQIRREVMLEWSNVSDNCPFSREDLDVIANYCHDPIRTILFGRSGQYQFKIYEDIQDLTNNPPLIGCDVSGAMYQDSSTIVVLDSRTTKVTATFNCNYIPADDLADLIYELITKYMPNGLVNIERNGGFGSGVVARLMKTSVKKNLYYEIKEKVVEERPNGAFIDKRKQLVKVFGYNTNKEIRARLIEILYERVRYHKDKFVAPILYDELSAMEVKKNGKVEHSDTSHDDTVFGLLAALYMYYESGSLAEFGVYKNAIKTDEDEEIVDGAIDSETNGNTENVNIDAAIDTDITLAIDESLDYLKEATKHKLGLQFDNGINNLEQQQLDYALAMNPAFKKAYNEANNFQDDPRKINYVTLPDSLFTDNGDDYDADYMNQHADNGNLSSIFINLN